MKNFFTIVLPVSFLLPLAASSADAQVYYYGPYWAPYGLAVDQYQGPDGKYDSEAGFIRSINGTPCGLECSARAAERWEYGR